MSSGSELEGMIAEVLLDPHVRDSCGVYIRPWMFLKKVYQYLVETLLTPQMMGRAVNQKVIHLYMQANYPDLMSQDWVIIESLIDRSVPISDQDLQSVINIVSTFIKDRLHQKGIDLYVKGMRVEAEPYLVEATTFKIVQNPFVNPNEEGLLDRLRDRDMPPGGRVIKSSLGLVNSVALYGGYKNGDLIMITLKAKAGKTLFAIQETAAAAAQGFNAAHMFFGDYSEFDGICRLLSCITGTPISEVVKNYNTLKRECERYLDHIRIASFPALSLDTYEVIAHLKKLRKQFDFSFCALDYDSNIRSPKEASMYESGGLMYGAFKGFASESGSAIMIGCQTKPEYWDMEVLPETAPNESSRKQHHVDFMICGGRNQKTRKVGTFNLPLVRRGVSGEMTRVRFDDVHSRIEDITPQEYERTIIENSNRNSEPSGDTVLDGVKFQDREM